MEPELLLIDKPKGITSFDVIRILQRLFTMFKTGHIRTLTFVSRQRGADDVSLTVCLTPKLETCFNEYIAKKPSAQKLVCGHAGTLDPLASGLMLIGVGSGTKKLNEYLKLDKVYEAEILVGEKRSTGDMEGEVVEEKIIENTEVTEIFSYEKISVTLESMIGILQLPVSAYSAIKKDGIPMYKRARKASAKGESIDETDLPVRNMTVHEAELIKDGISTIYRTNGEKGVVVQVRFKVGSGTYIRSLAEEFGRRLGYPATIKELRRTKVGEFRVEDAEKI